MRKVKQLIPPLLLWIGTSFADQDNPCDGPDVMNAAVCAGQKLDLQKKHLSEAFDNALARAKYEDKWSRNSGQKPLESFVLKSQEDWLNYRDSHCTLLAESRDAYGGWSGIHEANCVLEITRKRISFLNSLWAG